MPKLYYPINLDINKKRCLVVGGGKVAERKVLALLDFGARVIVVSPELTPKLKKLAKKRKITYFSRKYQSGDITSPVLAVGATSDPKLNQKISKDAQKKGVLVNVVDAPALCTYIVPAIVKRGPLIVSISTSGQLPALARALRIQLEKAITPKYGRLTQRLGRIRRKKLEA